jgi:shikimate dehydrogenase
MNKRKLFIMLNSQTKLYAVIGDPVGHSLSPHIHNAAFKKIGFNACYLAFNVKDVSAAIAGMKSLNIGGFSVTIPHKVEVMKYLDEIDPLAEKIGAVNTIVNRDGRLTGYNTDTTGAIKAIEEKTEIKNKNITILGAGGTARAIAFGITDKDGKLTILNRTVEKAEKLSKQIGCDFGPLTDYNRIKTDILINTTSVGMIPDIDASPIDTNLVKNMVVFDAIYNPEKTKLLQAAEKNGCAIISGKEMFINQAAEQFRLFTGKEIDINIFRGVLK